MSARTDRPEDLPEAGDPDQRPPEKHLDPTNPESKAMAPNETGDGDPSGGKAQAGGDQAQDNADRKNPES
jgi:hypothetical protein